MTHRAALVGLWVVACGDNHGVRSTDATMDASSGGGGCTAILTGNVAETTTSFEVCPQLQPGVGKSSGHTMIDFVVPSSILGPLAVRIDLGATAMPGLYSTETTRTWSAIAVENVPVRGSCIFTAGDESVPMGYFALNLDAIEGASTAHGSLALAMAVLPFASDQGDQSDCGSNTTEALAVRF